MQQFDYLKNGQTVSELRHLCKEATTDPKAVLSVCRQRTEEALCHSGEQTALAQARERARTLLVTLARAASECADHIPQPVSFFVSADDRRRGVAELSRLLMRIEPTVRELRELSVTLSLMEADFSRAAQKIAEAEKLLHLSLAAAREVGNEPLLRECEVLLSALACGRSSQEALFGGWKEARGLLFDFCSDVLRPFGARAEGASDMEHDGVGCNLSALRTLCGELKFAAERLEGRLEADRDRNI